MAGGDKDAEARRWGGTAVLMRTGRGRRQEGTATHCWAQILPVPTAGVLAYPLRDNERLRVDYRLQETLQYGMNLKFYAIDPHVKCAAMDL